MTVDVLNAAHLVFRERYADAAVAFAAGSLVRGEGTPYSDLDLVVVFPLLPAAYRESFRFQGLPVEVCVHDPVVGMMEGGGSRQWRTDTGQIVGREWHESVL